MKQMDKKYHFHVKSLIVVLAVILFACTKMDEYKDFIKDGEISYTGKIEELEAHPGHKRILLTGLLKSDPKITSVKLYWNSMQDSAIQEVTRSLGTDTVNFMLENMEENVYSFTFYTADAPGNLSVAVNKSGRVYGDKYLASLNNRLIESTSRTDTGTVVIWAEAGYLDGLVSTEVSYISNSDELISAFQEADDEGNTMVLSDHKEGTALNYRSLFVPDSMCIDTFYTRYYTKEVFALENPGKPFIAASSSGRWGILSGWITNDAVKNHGSYGGWSTDDGTVLCMESGWGSANIENGKIYQTLDLTPGDYSFTVDLGNNGYTGPVYLVATEGTGLPDADQLPDALDYVPLASQTLTFEVTEATTVSLGFLANMSGNQYWRVTSVSLEKAPY